MDSSVPPRIAVKNWRRFQHYLKRRPPWIKLHRELLDDPTFMRLPLASIALAPLVWLLASESDDGTVSGDVGDLVFRLRRSKDEIESGIYGLLLAGYLSDSSNTLAQRLQASILETEERQRQRERQKGNGSSNQPNVRANPLVDGQRPQMESEALRLTREIAAIDGRDATEVFADAAHYEGATRQKVNPASMTDDRLANTLIDLRATLANLKQKQRVAAARTR